MMEIRMYFYWFYMFKSGIMKMVKNDSWVDKNDFICFMFYFG